jgi:hypothetical protein
MFPNQVRKHAFKPKTLHKFLFLQKNILEIGLKQVKRLIKNESLGKLSLNGITKIQGFRPAELKKKVDFSSS